MAPTKESLEAIIRAARPTLQSKYDSLAFAVHAFMLADGYKLVAVGDHAERQLADSRTPKEVDVAGWNTSQESFSFQYVDSTGRRTPVLVQAMPMGPKLLVHWLSTREQTDPQTLELDVDCYIADIDADGMRQKPPLNAVSRADHADTADDGASRLLCQLHSNLWQVDLLLPAQYASSMPCPGSGTSYAGSGFSRQEALLPAGTAAEVPLFGQPQLNAVMAADIVAGFRHLDELCEKLNECLYATSAKPQTSAELRQSNRTEGESLGDARGGRQGPGSAGPAKAGPNAAEDPLRDPNFSGGPAAADERVSALLGDFGRGDMIPPGLPTMPHLPPGSGDLIPPGSGMMVGPDHPMFRQGGPRPGPGLPTHGGGLPGMHWDPIGPPGTPGFLPDDLQRPPPPGQVHPDLAPRGFPGPDWDSMYG